MANTRTLPAPERLPATRLLPDLDTCTDADLLDFAGAFQMSPCELPAAHAERLCKLIETLHCQLSTANDNLQVAQGVAAATMRELLASKDAHQATTLTLEAEIADAARRQVQLARARTEAADAIALNNKLREVVERVSGRTLEDIEAEYRAIVDADQADIRRRHDLRIARESAARQAYESQLMTWDVSDEVATPRTTSRTITRQVPNETMAEIVEKGFR